MRWTCFNTLTKNLECQRCGGTEHLTLPMDCVEAANVMFDFDAKHVLCREVLRLTPEQARVVAEYTYLFNAQKDWIRFKNSYKKLVIELADARLEIERLKA